MTLVMVLGCHNYKSARVIPGRSVAGDKCFASCRDGGGTEDKVLSCVSECPGAEISDDDCFARPGCVQTSELSGVKTSILVVSALVAFLALVAVVVGPAD